MAECPKCHQHLRLIDFKQNCKNCGANIFVYDLQERLMQDADKAEVQNYYFQRKLDRLKASFAGSKLAVTRIFTSLLPIGAVFLPLVKAQAVDALNAFNGNVNIMTIINNTDILSGDSLQLFLSSPLLVASAVLFALSLITVILHLILLMLACSPKGKIRNTILDIILLITSISAPILFMCLNSDAPVHGSIGVGSVLYILLQIINVFIDQLTFRKGIEVKHKQAYVGGIPFEEYQKMINDGISHEEIRAEQYRRLQSIQDEKIKQLEETEENRKKEETDNGR